MLEYIERGIVVLDDVTLQRIAVQLRGDDDDDDSRHDKRDDGALLAQAFNVEINADVDGGVDEVDCFDDDAFGGASVGDRLRCAVAAHTGRLLDL